MDNNITQNRINKLTNLKKFQTQILKLFLFDEKLFKRICSCGDYLQIEKHQNIQTLETINHVKQARTCKTRFCPLCNYYRVKNLTPQIVSELERLRKNGKEFIFATFTVPNCNYSDLRETIQRMNKSFAKMVTNEAFKNNVTDWIRTSEITYKLKNGKAHPHFHAILAVEPEYFKHKNYLKTWEWSKLWTRCYKSEKNLIVDVRKVKPKNENQSDAIKSAVAELSKYVTKSSDLKKLDVADMEIIYNQLKGLRFIATSRTIKLDETEEQKLDDELWRLIEYIFFGWHRKSQEYRHKKTVSREFKNRKSIE